MSVAMTAAVVLNRVPAIATGLVIGGLAATGLIASDTMADNPVTLARGLQALIAGGSVGLTAGLGWRAFKGHIFGYQDGLIKGDLVDLYKPAITLSLATSAAFSGAASVVSLFNYLNG